MQWLLTHEDVRGSHALVAQSASPRQRAPTPQGGHGPPQSSPVSEPLARPSLQVLATQVPLHDPERQSASTVQCAPTAHPMQLPPQSTSVSAPSLLPLVQVACSQTDAQIVPLGQSKPLLQRMPSKHAPQVLPPQSTLGSLPSSLWSLQESVQMNERASQSANQQSESVWQLR